MPQFVLDTGGSVAEPAWRTPPMLTVGRPLTWRDLDAFTQGYIEALFFTENDPSISRDDPEFTGAHEIPGDYGFADLAPEALARIIEDCRRFQAGAEWKAVQINLCWAPLSQIDAPDTTAGVDFWYTRSAHGVGFWDGEWPEPYASALTEAAAAFGVVDVYLGDDGKVWLS